MTATAGYGALDDGHQAGGDGDGSGSGEREHPTPRLEVEASSTGAVVRDALARPWARGVAALSVVILLASLPNRRSISRTQFQLYRIPRAYHDENQEMFYEDQLLDHFGNDTSTWTNRYYKSTNYFEGPGHPIFLIVGGPFITQHLAPHFGAAAIQPEHRFYGPYRPIMNRKPTVEELLELLTPQQAMADMVRLTKAFKEELQCSEYDRSSEKYCPVITVGGSYPGVLSAMLRMAYPDFVDVGYAAGAPLRMHAQLADQNSYYDIVTSAAEHLSPGCASAVSSALDEAKEAIEDADSIEEALRSMEMCVDTDTECISSLESLSTDVMMAVGFTFADYNMDAYPPPIEELGTYKACQIFQDKEATPLEKVANFFQLVKATAEAEAKAEAEASHKLRRRRLVDEQGRECFDLSVFLPDGENACITTADWSGAGGGNDGMMWDFQMCTTLIAPIGFSEESMFPAREWTLEGLTEYCHKRYGDKVTPRPYALVDEINIGDPVAAGASRILFTNGLRDIWSGGSFLEHLSDTIQALNFKEGAHHSELTHVGPTGNDTEEIREGFKTITNILEKWLSEIKEESRS